VRNGGATWGGIPITPSTIVRSYDTVLSLFFFSTFSASAYVVDGTPAAKRAKYLALAGTLVFGWWAIPVGPVRRRRPAMSLAAATPETAGP
jgi:hypothetical protein